MKIVKVIVREVINTSKLNESIDLIENLGVYFAFVQFADFIATKLFLSFLVI